MPSVEIALTRGKTAIVDREDYESVYQFKWYLSGDAQYASAYIGGGRRARQFITMHRLILGLRPGQDADHINGNGLDNRRANLRVATRQQNLWNMKKKKGRSRFKGVTWNKARNLWVAQIKYNYRGYNFGGYGQEIDAARAYDASARKYFGEFARTNFP